MAEKNHLIHKINLVAEFHDTFLIGNRYEPTAEVGENEFQSFFKKLINKNYIFY